VYKPVAQRTWGWYVCLLMRAGRMIGRIDAKVVAAESALVVKQVWWEGSRDERALRRTLEAHSAACGATSVQY
jgi:hypothetical protein